MTPSEIKFLIKECLTEVLEEARKICAWCKKDMGHFEGSGDSHGICPECKEKTLGNFKKQKPPESSNPQVP